MLLNGSIVPEKYYKPCKDKTEIELCKMDEVINDIIIEKVHKFKNILLNHDNIKTNYELYKDEEDNIELFKAISDTVRNFDFKIIKFTSKLGNKCRMLKDRSTTFGSPYSGEVFFNNNVKPYDFVTINGINKSFEWLSYNTIKYENERVYRINEILNNRSLVPVHTSELYRELDLQNSEYKPLIQDNFITLMKLPYDNEFVYGIPNSTDSYFGDKGIILWYVNQLERRFEFENSTKKYEYYKRAFDDFLKQNNNILLNADTSIDTRPLGRVLKPLIEQTKVDNRYFIKDNEVIRYIPMIVK